MTLNDVAAWVNLLLNAEQIVNMYTHIISSHILLLTANAAATDAVTETHDCRLSSAVSSVLT